jgi:hypothetical protein
MRPAGNQQGKPTKHNKQQTYKTKKQTNANKCQENKQTNKQNKQTNKQANKQTNKQTNRRTNTIAKKTNKETIHLRDLLAVVLFMLDLAAR